MNEPPQSPYPGSPGSWSGGGHQPPDPGYEPVAAQQWAGPPTGYGPPGGQPWAGPPSGYGPPPPQAGRDRLGPRTRRRADPRFGVALAAAGVVLAIVGVVVWSAGYFADGFHLHFDESSAGPTTSGTGRRFLGAGLSFLVVLTGYALLVMRRRGPLASAGAIAAALGVPLTLLFLTLDPTGGSGPFNIDAVLLISVLVWLVTYVFVPVAQGRPFFLGLAALYLASWAEFKAAPTSVVAFAVRLSPLSDGGDPVPRPGTGAVAATGLIFGVGYYVIAAVLDRRGRPGAGVAFVVAGLVATLSGVVAAAPGFGADGTGVLLIALGLVLGALGARAGRRFTTWVWAAAFVVGVVLVVADLAPDDVTAAGIALVIVGGVVVVAAQVYATVSREPDDMPDEALAARY